MPIYEWECGACGSSRDEYESTANSLEKCMMRCKGCGKYCLHFKRIGPTSFHLKGRGWAKDGYSNPLEGDSLAHATGDKFLSQYRKELRDEEHPRRPGDILKRVGRGRYEDLSDIGDPNLDLDWKRNRKRRSTMES